MLFKDRKDAGQRLARALLQYTNVPNTQVFALPRGGVVVGYEIASQLLLPLDIVCPRKIGAPFNPELAIGAVTETGESFLSQSLLIELGIEKSSLQPLIREEKKKAQWRLEYYRKKLPPRLVKNQCILLVDDGLATGSTMRAAIKTLRAEKAGSIVLAVPVAPQDTLETLSQEVDETICLLIPTPFYAVGQFYHNFEQTTDEEVIYLLNLNQTTLKP